MAGSFGHSDIDDYAAFLKLYSRVEETGSANRVDDVDAHDLVPANSPGTRAGISNLACDFVRGSSQKLSAPHHTDLSPTTGWAASLWAWLDDTGQYSMLLSKGDSGFYLFRRNDNTLQISCEQSDTTVREYTISETLQGAWHHLVGMATGGFLRLFIDGTQQGTPVSYDNTVKLYTTDFHLGRYGGGTPFFVDGALDEIAFWKDIVFPGTTEREAFVTALYNGGSGRFFSLPGSSHLTRDVAGVLDRTASAVLVRVLE